MTRVSGNIPFVRIFLCSPFFLLKCVLPDTFKKELIFDEYHLAFSEYNGCVTSYKSYLMI